MLNFRSDRDELADAFGALIGFVPTAQPLKPILLNFHVLSRDKQLLIEATDLDIAARIRVERVEIEEDGELALPAQRLSSLIREIPAKEVAFESVADLAGVDIRATGFEIRLLGQDPGEFPSIPVFDDAAVLDVPRDKFVETLRRVAVAASRDPARYQLAGVYLELDGDSVRMTATDGKRLTHDHFRISGSTDLTGSGILPNRAVDALLKVLPQGETEFRMALGENDLYVDFGIGEMTAKLVQGSFPDYQLAVSQEAKIKVTGKRSDFLTAARSAALMTDKETATVVFRFDDGVASLTTEARDIGESKIEVPIALNGEPVEIRFNPTYFIDALRCVTEDELRLEFQDSGKPGSIRGGQNYRHMLMPLVMATATTS